MATSAFVLSRSARAERTLRIDYSADATCPDEASFVAIAKEQTRRWPELAADADLTARVRATRTARGFSGELGLLDAHDTHLGARAIEAESCDDVVFALAVFLAVAMDAESAREAPPVAPPSHEREPPPPAPHDTPALAPRKKPVPEAPRRVRWLAAAAGQAYLGRGPTVGPGGSLAIEMSVPSRTAFAPSVQLALAAAPYSAKSVETGNITFAWGGLVLRGCEAWTKLRVRERGWEPSLCVRGELGGIRAASSGYALDRVEVTPWVAAGADLGIAAFVSPRVALMLLGGPTLPFIHRTFYLSGKPAFEVPWVTAELSVGAKFRIW